MIPSVQRDYPAAWRAYREGRVKRFIVAAVPGSFPLSPVLRGQGERGSEFWPIPATIKSYAPKAD